jgi:uncharacterized damage-inducible protein DinB
MPILMDKAQLLENIRLAHGTLETAIARLDEDHLLAPGPAGWSVKDILAHLAWHAREITGLAQSHILAGSEMWGWLLDERNQAIYLANRDRPLAEVRQEWQSGYAALLQALESLEEVDLHDPARFAGMPLDWQPWELIAENTYLHDRDHLAEIAAW